MRTELNLARKGTNDRERFRADLLTRHIVRNAPRAGEFLSALSRRTRVVLNKRTRTYGLHREDGPAFELVRASMNLMLASLLIAAATKLNLPLSTTYVTFMGTMGTSLCDLDCGAGTAEYRVAGVLHVIGAWLLTALGALSMAALLALLIHVGGSWSGVVLFAVVAAIIIRSHLPRRARTMAQSATDLPARQPPCRVPAPFRTFGPPCSGGPH